MSRLIRWFSAMASQAADTDSRFTRVGDTHVFDAGWVGGEITLSPEEVPAIRHTLYLAALLPWVTSIPLLFITVLILGPSLIPPEGAPPLLILLIGILWGALISIGLVLKHIYIAVVVRGKPKYRPPLSVAPLDKAPH